VKKIALLVASTASPAFSTGDTPGLTTETRRHGELQRLENQKALTTKVTKKSRRPAEGTDDCAECTLAPLLRHRHPRWASMRVGAGALTLWSFLMASAHGDGLMVVPVFLAMPAMAAGHDHHHAMQMSAATPASALLATGLHAAGYLLVTAAVALLVFEKLGVGMLRKTWFNLDLIWAQYLSNNLSDRVLIGSEPTRNLPFPTHSATNPHLGGLSL